MWTLNSSIDDGCEFIIPTNFKVLTNDVPLGYWNIMHGIGVNGPLFKIPYETCHKLRFVWFNHNIGDIKQQMISNATFMFCYRVHNNILSYTTFTYFTKDNDLNTYTIKYVNCDIQSIEDYVDFLGTSDKLAHRVLSKYEMRYDQNVCDKIPFLVKIGFDDI